MSEVLIGHVGVDSGQVMIGDPCYLSDWEANDFTGKVDPADNGEFSYAGACNASLSEASAGVLGNGLAIAASTAYGDGQYPVYAEVDGSGRIMALRIDFDPADEDEDDEECSLCGGLGHDELDCDEDGEDPDDVLSTVLTGEA